MNAVASELIYQTKCMLLRFYFFIFLLPCIVFPLGLIDEINHFYFHGQKKQRLVRSGHKESLQAFVKVQISLGNYHTSNMKGKGGGMRCPWSTLIC